jgi:hypothetical protein
MYLRADLDAVAKVVAAVGNPKANSRDLSFFMCVRKAVVKSGF